MWLLVACCLCGRRIGSGLGVCQYFSFLFAALGIISEASNITLGLQPISWLLLAILAGINAIIGHMHVVVAKNLLGIEAESRE
jgi:hypothetical protein